MPSTRPARSHETHTATDRQSTRLFRGRAEQNRGSAFDLLGRDLRLPLRHAPTVPKGIDELPVALAPERVLELMEDLGAGVERALPGSTCILDGNRQRPVGAAKALRRDGAQLRKLVGDHYLRVADDHLDLHVTPVGNADARAYPGAEGLGVPVGGAGRVANDDVGGDRWHTLSPVR